MRAAAIEKRAAFNSIVTSTAVSLLRRSVYLRGTPSSFIDTGDRHPQGALAYLCQQDPPDDGRCP